MRLQTARLVQVFESLVLAVSAEFFSSTKVIGFDCDFVPHVSADAGCVKGVPNKFKVSSTQSIEAFGASAADEACNAMLAADSKQAGPQFRPGESIDAILARTAKTHPAEPWNPNSILSSSEKKDQEKLIAKARDGIKNYRPYDNRFGLHLYVWKNQVKTLSHAQARELIESAGVDNVTSAHVGSAFDAFISAIPKAIGKIAVSSAVGQARQAAECVELADALQCISELAMDCAGAAVKSTGRIGINTVTSSWELQFFGQSIPPGVEEMLITPQQIQQIKDAIAELSQKPGMMASCPNEAVNQDQLRDSLLKELQALQAGQGEFLDAMGVEREQKIMMAVAFATIGAKIAVRTGGHIALNAVALGELSSLITLVMDPSMAAVTQGFANWQHTLKIARVGLHRYNVSQRANEVPQGKQLEDVANYMQDHFQHSAEANFHRKLDNVLYPRLGEQAVVIEAADYRIGQLQILSETRSAVAMVMAKKAFKLQREIDELNASFRPVRTTRMFIRKKPLPFLQIDTDVVKNLVAMAKNKGGVSNHTLNTEMSRHAVSLLTLHASPYEESIELMSQFKLAYSDRMGEAIEEKFLIDIYSAAQRELESWLDRNANPLKGPDRQKTIDDTSGLDRSGKRLSYIKDNLKLVIERTAKQKELAIASSEVAVLNSMAQAATSVPDKKHEQAVAGYKKELVKLKEKQVIDIRDFLQYKLDVENFANFNGDLIDPKGQVAKHILSRGGDALHKTSCAVGHRLADDFRKKGLGEYGTSLAFAALASGTSTGQSAIFPSGSKAITSSENFEYSTHASASAESPSNDNASELTHRPKRGTWRNAIPDTAKPIDGLDQLELAKIVRASHEKYSADAAILAAQVQTLSLHHDTMTSELAQLEQERNDATREFVREDIEKEFDSIWRKKHADEVRDAFYKRESELTPLIEESSRQIDTVRSQLQAVMDLRDKALAKDKLIPDFERKLAALETQLAGNSSQISSNTFDDLLKQAIALNPEYQGRMLPRLITVADKLPKRDASRQAAGIVRDIHALDPLNRLFAYRTLFAKPAAHESSSRLAELLMYAKTLDPDARSVRYEWAAMMLKHLPENDRLDGAFLLMQRVQLLPVADRIKPIYVLSREFESFKGLNGAIGASLSDGSDGPASLFGEILDQVRQFPRDERAAPLLLLARRFDDFAASRRPQIFSTIADMVGDLAPADRAPVLEQLMKRFDVVLKYNRGATFEKLIALGQTVPPGDRELFRTLAFKKIAICPSGIQNVAFEKMLKTLTADKPSKLTVQPGGGATLDSATNSPDLSGSVREMVPTWRTDGSFEIVDLIKEIEHLSPLNRLPAFKAALGRLTPVLADKFKLAPMAALARQIVHLPTAEQQQALDAWLSQSATMTPVQSASVQAYSIAELPRALQSKAVHNALDTAEKMRPRSSIFQSDQPVRDAKSEYGEALLAIASHLHRIPIAELPELLEKYFEALGSFGYKDTESDPIFSVWTELRNQLMRIPAGQRGKLIELRNARADQLMRNGAWPIEYQRPAKYYEYKGRLNTAHDNARVALLGGWNEVNDGNFAYGHRIWVDNSGKGRNWVKEHWAATPKPKPQVKQEFFGLEFRASQNSLQVAAKSSVEMITEMVVPTTEFGSHIIRSDGKLAGHARVIQILEKSDKPRAKQALLTLAASSTSDRFNPTSEGGLSETSRVEISETLKPFEAKKLKKQFVFQAVDKTSGARVWKAADNLDLLLNQLVHGQLVHGSIGTTKIFEVLRTSDIPTQFAVLNSYVCKVDSVANPHASRINAPEKASAAPLRASLPSIVEESGALSHPKRETLPVDDAGSASRAKVDKRNGAIEELPSSHLNSETRIEHAQAETTAPDQFDQFVVKLNEASLREALSKIADFGKDPNSFEAQDADRLLGEVRVLDGHGLPNALALLASSLKRLNEPQKTAVFNSIWKWINRLGPDVRDGTTQQVFNVLQPNQKTTLLNFVLNNLNDKHSEPDDEFSARPHPFKLDFVASNISKLRSDDALVVANSVLAKAADVSGEDCAEAFMSLVKHTKSLNKNDSNVLFDRLLSKLSVLEPQTATNAFAAMISEIPALPREVHRPIIQSALMQITRLSSDEQLTLSAHLMLQVGKIGMGIRKPIFISLLKHIETFEAEGQAILFKSLAPQIGAISNGLQQSAYDVFKTSVNKLGDKGCEFAWANCLSALPERFRMSALRDLSKLVDVVDEASRVAALKVIAPALLSLAKTELREAFDLVYQSISLCKKDDIYSPVHSIWANMNRAMTRLPVEDRAHVEAKRHQANIEIYVNYERSANLNGSGFFRRRIYANYRNEKLHPLKEEAIEYDA